MAKHKEEPIAQVTRLKAWPKEIVSRMPPEPEPVPEQDDEDPDEDEQPDDLDPKVPQAGKRKRGARKK